MALRVLGQAELNPRDDKAAVLRQTKSLIVQAGLYPAKQAKFKLRDRLVPAEEKTSQPDQQTCRNSDAKSASSQKLLLASKCCKSEGYKAEHPKHHPSTRV